MILSCLCVKPPTVNRRGQPTTADRQRSIVHGSLFNCSSPSYGKAIFGFAVNGRRWTVDGRRSSAYLSHHTLVSRLSGPMRDIASFTFSVFTETSELGYVSLRMNVPVIVLPG